jgi:hypothetical protein
MNPDEAAIVTEIGEAVRALNAALAKAHDAGLAVDMHCASVARIDREGARSIYSAEVSKKAFSHRV